MKTVGIIATVLVLLAVIYWAYNKYIVTQPTVSSVVTPIVFTPTPKTTNIGTIFTPKTGIQVVAPTQSNNTQTGRKRAVGYKVKLG